MLGLVKNRARFAYGERIFEDYRLFRNPIHGGQIENDRYTCKIKLTFIRQHPSLDRLLKKLLKLATVK